LFIVTGFRQSHPALAVGTIEARSSAATAKVKSPFGTWFFMLSCFAFMVFHLTLFYILCLKSPKPHVGVLGAPLHHALELPPHKTFLQNQKPSPPSHLLRHLSAPNRGHDRRLPEIDKYLLPFRADHQFHK